jgi:hypothetical protein
MADSQVVEEHACGIKITDDLRHPAGAPVTGASTVRLAGSACGGPSACRASALTAAARSDCAATVRCTRSPPDHCYRATTTSIPVPAACAGPLALPNPPELRPGNIPVWNSGRPASETSAPAHDRTLLATWLAPAAVRRVSATCQPSASTSPSVRENPVFRLVLDRVTATESGRGIPADPPGPTASSQAAQRCGHQARPAGQEGGTQATGRTGSALSRRICPALHKSDPRSLFSRSPGNPVTNVANCQIYRIFLYDQNSEESPPGSAGGALSAECVQEILGYRQHLAQAELDAMLTAPSEAADQLLPGSRPPARISHGPGSAWCSSCPWLARRHQSGKGKTARRPAGQRQCPGHRRRGSRRRPAR